MSLRTRFQALAARALVLPLGLVVASTAAAQGSSLWTSFGQNLANTRHQANETRITPANVHRLGVKWVFETGGDVSATPAVDGDNVYVPDWSGRLHAVNRVTGLAVWTASIPAASGVAGDKARATPAVAGDKVIVGTQGGPAGGGGKVLAFDRATGALRWSTQVDTHFAAIITQSVAVHGGRVYVGAASLEEALAAFIPNYPCCSFRGVMAALDLGTGAVLWKTFMAPDGYSGAAIWGSAPAIDPKRGQLYIATGNNYAMPDAVQACVALAGDDAAAQQACISPANLFDAVVALDLATGAVRWATKALPFDAWTVGCLLGGVNCPQPAGPDYDFGQAPSLFKVAAGPNAGRELLGAGQKSGKYWALDPATGAVQWTTQAGPGGTAGGLQWGSAVDGQRIYTANANSDRKPWTMPDGSTHATGVWSALDAGTGQLLWQTRPAPDAEGGASGPVSVANGVVFGCTLDTRGTMVAMSAATGAVLWRFHSGSPTGSCLSGAAISKGEVFWGAGYSNFGFGLPNNKLYAFELK